MTEPKRYKILLVEDNPANIELMNQTLKKEGFNIFSASLGEEAINMAKTHLPEIVIIDIGLPDMDGIVVCENIREIPEMHNSIIAFLTGRFEDYTQIAAFNAGADDYMIKPVSNKLLLTRVKAYVKRYDNIHAGKDKKIFTNSPVETKHFIIYPEKYSIFKNNKFFHLTKKEFDILMLLVSNKNNIISREDIYNKVWGDKSEVLMRTLDVHIRKLREKIGQDYIVTLHKFGYKFVE